MTEQFLGKYQLLERIGKGGMAEVFRGYHERLDRYVAIKVLHPFLAEDKEFQARFAREAQNIARLKHPNIVQVYDFDYDLPTNRYYMVMELVQGVTLKDYLTSLHTHGKSVPLRDALRMTREAASALAYAHDNGMLHRDVKPANLMINQDNHIVLTDFGIARLVDSKQLTASGGIAGTPAYLSPEQGIGEAGDGRSDIYALGIILFQMLTGELPYNAENALSVLMMHVNDPIPNVYKYNPQVPSTVKGIVERAMAKDPKQRYQTAHELIEDIHLVERGLAMGIRATATVPPLQPTVTIPKVQTTLETSRVSLSTHPKMQPIKPERKTPIASVVGWLVFLVALVGVMGWIVLRQVNQISDNDSVGVATITPIAMTKIIPTVTLSATVSYTPSPIPTQTFTPIPTQVASATSTPTILPTLLTPAFTATLTPNATQTALVLTSSAEPCVYDYAIINQEPADGSEGGYFTINTRYTRLITLLNVGTCEWGINASLTFIRGEDFNAGPRIFFRESVGVGDEVTLTFEGTTPSRGAFDPVVGTWELRTRLQQTIGQPFIIAVQVYDPGPRN